MKLHVKLQHGTPMSHRHLVKVISTKAYISARQLLLDVNGKEQ